jgi:hypothetical protein
MTSDPTSTRASSADIDALLAGAFEQALSAAERADVIDGVMRRIRTRQRHRAIVLTISGFVAAVICVANVLPLLDMATGALQQANLPDRLTELPVIVTGLVALLGGVGLLSVLLDEAP